MTMPAKFPCEQKLIVFEIAVENRGESAGETFLDK